jgi:hypothetical protein
VLLFGTRPPKATGDARKLRPPQEESDRLQDVEFLILGGLVLLQVLLVWA